MNAEETHISDTPTKFSVLYILYIVSTRGRKKINSAFKSLLSARIKNPPAGAAEKHLRLSPPHSSGATWTHGRERRRAGVCVRKKRERVVFENFPISVSCRAWTDWSRARVYRDSVANCAAPVSFDRGACKTYYIYISSCTGRT